MPSLFKVHRSKLRAVLERAKVGSFKKESTSSSTHGTLSHWDTLPTELQVVIFSECSLSDIFTIRLVSRTFRDLIDTNEPDIARSHLRLLRHGSLPTRVEDIDQDYDHEPEDDVRLLSDLFPPSKTRQGTYVYNLRYLKALSKRLDVCTRLSYHLAEVVMDLYIASANVVNKKAAKETLVDGRDRLRNRLTPSLFYILHFFESYSLARLDHQNSLHIDYDSGRLPVPMTVHDRCKVYLAFQRTILSSPPFTHTPTLITTHHAMHVLQICLRSTISLDQGIHVDCWISMLLNYSGLGRIAEFFAAEKESGGLSLRGNNKRREFMKNMERDQKGFRRDSVRAVVFAGDERATEMWEVGRFWFRAAKDVLEERGVLPHDSEKGVVVGKGWRMWETIALSCSMCKDIDGWEVRLATWPD